MNKKTAKKTAKRTPDEFKQEFIRRTKQARETVTKDRDEMGTRLGVEKDTYAKYEYRTLLPHYLIPKLCEETKTGPWYLLTGEPEETNPGLQNTGQNEINPKRMYTALETLRQITAETGRLELQAEYELLLELYKRTKDDGSLDAGQLTTVIMNIKT